MLFFFVFFGKCVTFWGAVLRRKKGGYKKVTLMTFCFRLLEEKIERKVDKKWASGINLDKLFTTFKTIIPSFDKYCIYYSPGYKTIL